MKMRKKVNVLNCVPWKTKHAYILPVTFRNPSSALEDAPVSGSKMGIQPLFGSANWPMSLRKPSPDQFCQTFLSDESQANTKQIKSLFAVYLCLPECIDNVRFTCYSAWTLALNLCSSKAPPWKSCVRTTSTLSFLASLLQEPNFDREIMKFFIDTFCSSLLLSVPCPSATENQRTSDFVCENVTTVGWPGDHWRGHVWIIANIAASIGNNLVGIRTLCWSDIKKRSALRALFWNRVIWLAFTSKIHCVSDPNVSDAAEEPKSQTGSKAVRASLNSSNQIFWSL